MRSNLRGEDLSNEKRELTPAHFDFCEKRVRKRKWTIETRKESSDMNERKEKLCEEELSKRKPVEYCW